MAELPEIGEKCVWPEPDNVYRRLLVGSYWVYYAHDEIVLTAWRIFHVSEDIDDVALIEWD